MSYEECFTHTARHLEYPTGQANVYVGPVVGSSEGDQEGVVPGINVGCMRDAIAIVLRVEVSVGITQLSTILPKLTNRPVGPFC